jgi:chromosome segregation ATPase
MSEIKKLEQTEIDSIKELQTQYNKIIFELGGYESQIITFQKQIKLLENEKQKLSVNMDEINGKEKILVDSLQTKYGAGSIDIETGEITTL